MIDVKYINPNSFDISKHILHYYFLKSEKNQKYSFTHFPHYRTTLNIFYKADIEINKSNMILNFNNNAKTVAIFNSNKLTYKTASINGSYDIIGIVFKPLGINNFLRRNLNTVLKNTEFFNIMEWEGFNTLLDNISEEKIISEKAKMLDAFFLQNIQSSNLNKLHKIIDFIIERNGSVKVKELENLFNVNRRTLLRLFKNHLCCSIMDFKRTVKFRNSLEDYQVKDYCSLTDLSHNSQYYDQSDFINQFKSITGKKPNQVLDKIDKVGKQNMYWLFEN